VPSWFADGGDADEDRLLLHVLLACLPRIEIAKSAFLIAKSAFLIAKSASLNAESAFLNCTSAFLHAKECLCGLQTAVTLTKTDFFYMSSSGSNAYTFLDYMNVRVHQVDTLHPKPTTRIPRP